MPIAGGTAMLGKRGGDIPKSGEVVELLPNWRKNHVA
jgi:hypothetical protein